MKLLAVYSLFVAIGVVVAYAIGRAVEAWSAPLSLPVFLAAFFLVFWVAWRGAIRVA
jgi:hypothetical protein